MKRFRKPSPAMIVACISLAIALSGASYAAVTLPRNSVGTPQIKKNAVNSSKVKDGSLKRGDFATGQIPAGATGPAGPAGPAGAPNPNAVSAQNADLLDSLDSTAFMRSGAVRVALTEDLAALPANTSFFTTQAGQVLITVSGTGYRTTVGNGCLSIAFDMVLAAQRCHYFNQVNSHMALIPQTFVRTVSAGSHRISLDAFSGLAADPNDIYEVTVIEIP